MKNEIERVDFSIAGNNKLFQIDSNHTIGFEVLISQAESMVVSCFEKSAEMLLVIQQGCADIEIAGAKKTLSRTNVFAQKAEAFFVPLATTVKITMSAQTQLAICKTPATKQNHARFIARDHVKTKAVGKDNWLREVHDIFLPTYAADSMIVGETFNPPGNWSSYPPHKHDKDIQAQEVRMEEIYYYQLEPKDGFAIQRVYSDEMDNTYMIQNGNALYIDKGYHPIVAGAGFRLYYLWVLCGENRVLLPNTDPKFRWILDKL